MDSADLIPLEVDEFSRYERRRLKAAIALACVWSCTVLLHVLVWGQWIVYGLTVITTAHLVRVLLIRPHPLPDLLPSWRDTPSSEKEATDFSCWPHVSILVAAKNEVEVIERLTSSLMAIDYPSKRFDVWLIDDNSTDGTSELMDDLARRYVNLNAIHRDQAATGGKSGALNQVWPTTQGSILLVFDADAQVSPDCLRQVVPLFEENTVGAVQLRKAIANGTRNFWTRGQVAEMAFDAYCQLKRISNSGIGELRGNGQFVRRAALEQCGGWNEETITDDLDLTLKLHLTGWDVPLVMTPAVWEEGVVQAISLWHQRNRWAEGGYQRYLDYWRLLTPRRLGWNKTFDLFVFWLIQYGVPTAAFPDFALAIARNRLPMLMPVSSVAALFATVGMASGLWQTRRASPFSIFVQTIRGMVYMMHWFVVVGAVTFRMAIRPKRLKWVKTQHGNLEDTAAIAARVSSQ
ncbi:glycosyltransferase family 2 protein [Oscillatoria sp. CS-180]|nr:glycosyltransferase family 2 protein [Oscillatoria sp. CS-180]